MKTKIASAKTPAHTLPIITVSCTLDSESSAPEGRPHLEGLIVAKVTVGDRLFEASISRNFDSTDNSPHLFLNGARGDETIATVEDCPGDSAMLNMLIGLLTSLRDASDRELDGMITKSREFDAFIEHHLPQPQEKASA